MKKILLLLYLICLNVYADVDQDGYIINGSVIKASDMNTYFDKIKNKLSEHNVNITFHQFTKGELISSNKIKEELSKIPMFIQVNPTLTSMIKTNVDSSWLRMVRSQILTDIDSYQNIFVKYADKYDISCNCYKDIKYAGEDDSVSWNDTKAGVTGYRTLDIYKSENPNGKTIFYTHEMSNTKDMLNKTGLPSFQTIKNNFLAQGYHFISVEFRHPILESLVPNSDSNYDILTAHKFIRKNYHDFGLSHPDKFYSLSYSKGSHVIASLFSNGGNPNDAFGRVSFEKIYTFDAQITYMFDIYYNLFVNTTNCLGIIAAKTCFSDVNTSAALLTGFSLSKTYNVANYDTYALMMKKRNISNSDFNTQNMTNTMADFKISYLGRINLPNGSIENYPKIRLGYNNLAKATKMNANGVTLGQDTGDYLLHNPRAYNEFCASYNAITSVDGVSNKCSGITGLGLTTTNVYNDIEAFFNN